MSLYFCIFRFTCKVISYSNVCIHICIQLLLIIILLIILLIIILLYYILIINYNNYCVKYIIIYFN